MLFVIIRFINPLSVFSISIWHFDAHMKIHKSIIGFLTLQHLAMLRNFQFFQFLFMEKIHWSIQGSTGKLKFKRLMFHGLLFYLLFVYIHGDILFVKSYKKRKILLSFNDFQYYIIITLLNISKNMRTTTFFVETLLYYQSH